MIIPELVWPIALGLVTLIQLCYYLFLFSRFIFYKKPLKKASQQYPVSVVICARDEAKNLAKNLPGVLVQDYPTTHEIIVVNDNSTDESKYVLEGFQQHFKNLTVVPLTQEAKHIPGKKFPLSIGIKSAKNEVLLLTDADCIPASEHWIEKMQDAYLQSTDVVLGYGAYNKKPGLLNKIIRFETFHTALQYFSYALAGMPYMGVGRNLSYRRELFVRNKGFSAINQIPSGDDDLFINKVAKKDNVAIVFDKDTHTLSEPPKTWSDWFAQKSRHYTTAKFYKPLHRNLLSLYAFSQTFIYPLTIAAAIFYNWQIALVIFLLRFIVQAVIWNIGMKKLNEADLFPYFVLFDIWLFIYNIIFFPTLFRKPKKRW